MNATQVALDADTAHALRRELGLAEIGAPISGGTFALVHAAVASDGRAAVLKVGPPPHVPLLTYERGLAPAEFEFYERTAAILPVPDVLAHTEIAERHAFTMTLEPGTPLVDTPVSDDERRAVRRQLGRLVGELRSVTGTGFGYRRSTLDFHADSWPEAFDLMWRALFEDARHWAVELPTHRVGELLRRAHSLLAGVHTPVLTHFDLWDGNVLVARDDNGIHITALIDGERSFWGDPLAELVSTSLFSDPETDTDFLEGFAESTGSTLDFTPDVRARLSLYQAYLSAIMIVERVPRGAADDRAQEEFFRGALRDQLDRAADALDTQGL